MKTFDLPILPFSPPDPKMLEMMNMLGVHLRDTGVQFRTNGSVIRMDQSGITDMTEEFVKSSRTFCEEFERHIHELRLKMYEQETSQSGCLQTHLRRQQDRSKNI